MLRATRLLRRAASTAPAAPAPAPPVAVVMLNMGGPATLDAVEPFLRALFNDGEIIALGPLQRWLGPFIAQRRAPRIREQYAAIGGGSPIGAWTALQGAAMEAKLNARAGARAGAPRFKAYTAFRYAEPGTETALRAMQADGVTRAIAFSQFPQWSCTTAGSSMNHLWRESLRLGLERAFSWSVIDRWPLAPGFVAAVARNVATGLARFAPEERDSVVLLFSAHSVPMLTVNKGDAYVQEVGATVSAVVAALRAGGVAPAPIAAGAPPPPPLGVVRAPYVLSWQSKVGFLPWMGPNTSSVIAGLARAGHRRVLAVPIAFTSDHVETLFEIDVEYAEEAHKVGDGFTREARARLLAPRSDILPPPPPLSRRVRASQLGMHFERAPSLNDSDLLTTAQADLVEAHYASGEAVATPQYGLNCAGCVNPACRSILNPVAPYTKLRDAAAAAASAAGTPHQTALPAWPSAADAAACVARGATPNH